MGHTQEKGLHKSLQQHYHRNMLRYTIDKFKWKHCQQYKFSGKGYDLIPEQEMWLAPREGVASD